MVQERVLWWASILSSKRAQCRGSDPTCKIASKHRPTSPSPRGISKCWSESGSMPHVQACTWCLLRTRVERFEERGGLPRRLLCTSRVSTKHATGSTHTHTHAHGHLSTMQFNKPAFEEPGAHPEDRQEDEQALAKLPLIIKEYSAD